MTDCHQSRRQTMLIELAEYRTREGVPLSLAQRDALRRVAPSISVSPTRGIDGAYDLTPGSSIGAVRIPDLELIVRPKLAIDRVLFVLSYAMGITAWRSEAF